MANCFLRETACSKEAHSDLAFCAENFEELLRGYNLELRVGAIGRLLIRPPAAKLRDVPEAIALHVIVGDLDHELGPERFPGEIFTLTPATLATGHALRCAGFLVAAGPCFPRMIGKRVFTIRLQEFSELLASIRRKTGTHSDMLQRAGIIIETKQQ